MKRTFLHILGYLLLIAPLAVTADSEGPYTYTISGTEATITAFDRTISGSLSITNELGTYPVTTIDYEAFESCTNLTHVTIPNTVITVNDRAFYACSSLIHVTLSDSVTTINRQAFASCPSLTTITIGNSVVTIEALAFDNCTSLTSIAIPDSVTTVGESTFNSCTNMTQVTIGIGLTSLGNSVFTTCSSLTNITVASSNSNYSSQDGVLFDHEQTTLIQYPSAKQGAYNIPASVIIIDPGAFMYCMGLSNVLIGNGITTIDTATFYFCTGLSSVTIGNSVTNINDWAFYGCTNLQRVYFTGNPPLPDKNVFIETEATLYYLSGTSGWDTTYSSRSTMLWNPTFSVANLDSDIFSCTINGTAGIPVALEACENLQTGQWTRLLTTQLTDTEWIFQDTEADSHSTRFYRIVGP